MVDLTIPVLTLIDSLVFVILAVWAHEIGLDPNASWGRTRLFLLCAGLLLFLISVYLFSSRRKPEGFAASFIQSKTARVLISLGHIWLIVILIYLWFISYGTWTSWKDTTNYYDQLASAFAHGQLNIDIKPGAALLASPDPYNPAVRPVFNTDIWDMSLFEGKLYIYWGPLPALLIAPIKLFSSQKITDNYLVFFFFSGLLMVNSLIILTLWKRFFEHLPEWSVLICVLLAGLVLPILWSVNDPRVYTAAIGAGQFFLMGGFFFVLSATAREGGISHAKLFLAGLFWACSVGSRAINALSVIFFTGLILLWLMQSTRSGVPWKKTILAATALVAPLMLGAAVIGWYDWARFGSPFETGFRYAITILDLNRQANLVFQAGYFFLNVFYYVFQPFSLALRFPFIYPVAMSADILHSLHVAMPQIFFAGRMTGLLFCAPFLLLSLLALRQDRVPAFPGDKSVLKGPSVYRLVVYLLAGSFMAGFLGLMFFFFAQMRYLVDIISQITLLAIIGYWKIISARSQWNPTRSRILLGSANLLLVFTICIGLLLSVSSDFDRLQTLNPALFERITNSLSLEK